jgi:toxin CptA
MHSAPSVTYPVGRSRWAAALLSLAWLAGAAATLQWTLHHEVSGARLATAWLVLIAAGAVAAWSWQVQPRGSLSWDGARWTWDAPAVRGASGSVRVSVDLQQVLLVRWRAEGSAQWLWLERASAPERWADLRRAVYSRARPETLPLAQPPAAKP